MLHKACLPANTLGVLEKISSDPRFDDFFLVGGTALSLYLGHRISVDLDFFTLKPINHLELFSDLQQQYKAEETGKTPISLFVNLNGVKTDFVSYTYPLLNEIKKVENIRLASLQDVAAMKLSAITNRGTKKDFADIYYLLEQFTRDELISFYVQKYGEGSDFYMLKSILYFEDAELSDMPLMLNKEVDWNNIKERISNNFR